MRKVACIISLALTMMAALTAFTVQSDFAQLLQENLQRYYERQRPEKLYMTFSQPVYAAGDTAWYKLSVFSASGLVPTAGRQIAEVILVDDTGAAVRRHKVLITDGSANNQIVIPQNAKPGLYTVVAFVLPKDKDDDSRAYQHRLWVSGPVQQKEYRDGRIGFFPEGGNFIAGITNKIVVNGPPHTEGVIVNANEEQVAAFTLDANGLGLFMIKPEAGGAYRATIAGRDDVSLPLAANDGIGLLTSVPSNGLPIRVTVQVPESSQYTTQDTHLVMTGHASVLYAAKVSFRNSNFMTFSFPQDNIPEGVARINIFDAEGKSVAERLLLIRRAGTANIELDLERQTVSRRDEMGVTISLNDHDGKPVPGELSVTVYHEDLIPARRCTESKTILDAALLYGDINASTACDGPEVDDPSVDNFLITQAWSHFSWSDIVDQDIASRTVDRLLHFQGNLSRTDGQPLADSSVLTFFLQRSIMAYEVFPDEIGNFNIPLLIDFYGEDEVYYQAESRGQIIDDVELKLAPHATFQVERPVVTSVQEPDAYFRFSQKKNVIDKSYDYHLRKYVAEAPRSLNSLIEEEVFGPDVKVALDDYLLFPTMSETLREIVPMLQHRKRKGVDVIRLYFEDYDRFGDDEPLLVIDGVITDNTTYFLNLKPADVASIALIHSLDKLRTFGPLGKNGIVLVETKIHGNADLVPRSERTFTATGLEKDLFKSAHSRLGGNESVPDLRTNLYWNPEVMIDSIGQVRLNIHTSDVTGTFKIRIEGFTDRRTPVFAEKEFQVVFE